MKKCVCFVLSILLVFVCCGCSKEDSNLADAPSNANPGDTISTPIDTTPANDSEMNYPLPLGEYETVSLDKYDYVYGRIAGKVSATILALKLDVPSMVSNWGETVYIVTDQADQWCVGDEIEVTFTKVERPCDKTQYVQIIADEVKSLVLCAKPIIYLYPTIPTECSVGLTIKGELTCTYPRIDEGGWNNFMAYPDGTLIFPDGKEYYALYWEGVQNAQWDFSQGFCVSGEDTAAFLEWALAAQGLTRREANEFIVYWLPLMQDNPYNVISFQTDAYTDGAVLDIIPAPDRMLRVFMAYYPAESEVDIEPQSFDTFQREGFTVVEWGGSQLKMP